MCAFSFCAVRFLFVCVFFLRAFPLLCNKCRISSACIHLYLFP
jgi:hypothetical protein